MSWLRIRAVARRNAIAIRRSPHRWFDFLGWPLVDAILFGAIAASFGATGNDAPLGFFLAATLLFHVIFQSQVGVAMGFLEETWSRNLLNMLVTPLREMEYVMGVTALALFRVVCGSIFIIIAAAVLYAVNAVAAGLAMVPMIALLLVVGVSIGLLVIGMVLRFGQSAEILTWAFIAIWLPLSGIFYPIDSLPVGLQPISEALPTTHIFSALRTVLDGEPMPWSQIGIAAVLTLILLLGSMAFLRWMLALFRTRGYISRHT
jgi:ABC-2 type transport system permease protein